MSIPLKILMVEDSRDDADLLQLALRSAGYAPQTTRVDNPASMQQALTENDWDLVISDYVLPGFSGLEALKILQASDLEIPFIVVSGKIGEEVAVEALQAGANDYLLKDRLKRLGPAIERALKDVSLRRKRKQAEAALRESEERYRRLVESCPDAMFILSEGKFSYVNPAAVKLLEAKSPLELLGRQLTEFLDSNYRDLVEEHLRQAEEGMDGPLLEQKLISTKGRAILVEAIARSISYHGEKAMQILCRDISSRKTMEQQLLSSQKMEAIGRLAGGVANDFNNLLTVINGYAGLLRSGLSPDHPLQNDVQQIVSSAERAISLTNQLLALSRKEAVSPQPLDLNTVIEQNLPLIKRMMGEQISCITRLDPMLNMVRADRGQIETALLNLAAYARESMPQGGQLLVETSNYTACGTDSLRFSDLKAGEYVVLVISDNGIGISDELREQVFEPFMSQTQVGQNTGLRLATVYAIVKQHNGHIWCTSEIGKGSTFRIYLPKVSRPRASAAPVKRAPLIEAVGGTVLIVEDEEVLRDFARLILRKHGFMAIAARNGEEALRILQTNDKQIDLIFTDVVMPIMGGAEFSRRIKELESKVPILFTSGYPRHVLLDYGLTNTNFEFIQKPYTTPALIEKVKEMVSQGRARSSQD
ncbi:MAG: response regulator [Verrucomicrobiales bacterium]